MDSQVDEVLKKYGLTRANATNYIEAITRLNQTETADEIDLSRETIRQYKKAFQKMTRPERLQLISSLAQDRLLERVQEKSNGM